MKVVVFGASGFVGRNIVHHLGKSKIEFLATDVVESPFDNEINYRKIDILDYENVRSVIEGYDVVIHLAASPLHVSLKNPRLNMKINIEGTLNILDASREFKVDKIVFSSASSVIGEVVQNPVDESHQCVPKTPYATAKKSCEDYFRIYHDLFGVKNVVFRFFNVFGPWQFPESGALVPLIYSNLVSRKPFTIYGDGSATRDFIFVDIVADYILRSIKKDVESEIVNLGSGTPTTIMELIDLSSKILELEPIIKFKPKRAGEIDNFFADTSKLERLFGNLPSSSINTYLQNTFLWLEKNT
jgi:UDP-glucose 4-epimerase